MEEKPKDPCSVRGITGKGKAGRVNENEPSMLLRDCRLRWRDVATECRTGRWKAAGAGRLPDSGRESTAVPEFRGQGARREDLSARGQWPYPPQPYLTRVERGNPDGVRSGNGPVGPT
jgi:hypothetical protein